MIRKIYDFSPIFFQNFLVSMKGRQIVKERYNDEYYKEFNLLKNMETEYEHQEKRFINFINYIGKNSEYFNETLSQLQNNISIENLNQIPIMEKEDIRLNIGEIVTRKSNIIEMKTGGSTGKSLTFYTHPEDISKRIAYLDFFKEKHGVIKGMRRVSIGGRVIVPNNQRKKIFWRYNKPLNQLLLSAYHADGENLKYYVEKLNDFKPQSIDGYTTTIHRLAKFILNNDIKLTFNLIAIFPTAEALTPEMRYDIEKAFNCSVRNQYSSSEGAPFITENVDGKLDINPATGIFELEHIQDNLYELIVTSFYTTTTPLLRYKIGDTVELETPLPENYKQSDIKIKRIIGRNNDFLYSNERGIVTNVNLSTAIREANQGIIDSQFVQNSIDEITVNLVVNNNINKNKLENALTNSLKIRFGDSMRYKFKYVSEIETTLGGKKRFTINNLKV